MPLRLVIDEDVGFTIPVDSFTEEAWVLQLGRVAEQGDIHAFCQRVATCFASTLTECLDVDLRPPTDAQLKYATAIARDLNVALPAEALRFRAAMTEFLSRFAEVHKEMRRGYHTSGS